MVRSRQGRLRWYNRLMAMEFPGHVPVVITAKNGWETTLLLPEKLLQIRRTSVIVLPSESGHLEERHMMICLQE